MLLVLISIVWFALLVLLAAICRVAADGDGGSSRPAARGSISIGDRLTLSPLSGLADRRPAQSRRGQRHRPGSLRYTRGRRRAHGVR
ncbi:MAG: hypothetical protein ACYDHT_06830 [Solirubrobacteraceae bacterium]